MRRIKQIRSARFHNRLSAVAWLGFSYWEGVQVSLELTNVCDHASVANIVSGVIKGRVQGPP